MEYAQHRYLTKDSASTFLSPDFQMQEATLFAGRVFKRVMYYACSDPARLLPPVTEMLTGFEGATRADLEWVERSALTLLENGDRAAARKLLTYYAGNRAMEALELGTTMAEGLDGYITLTGNRQRPSGIAINTFDPTVNCLADGDPDSP